jgi:N-acetylglucosaminyl-diphospho-decaprenol L-rhamnosyltransferase
LKTSLAIVIVSYNTRDLTLRALEAAHIAARGISATISVADNGSSDGTALAMRDAFPDTPFVVYFGNPGYGTALNLTLAGSSAPYFLALNSDVLLDVGALEPMIRFLDHHPECAIAGPVLNYPDGRPQPSAKRFPSLRFALGELFFMHSIFPRSRSLARFYYADQDLANCPWVDTLSGAAILIRAEAFRRIGGFDDCFRMYFEEIDLCRRLHDAGTRVALCPQATAVHWHGASSIQTSVRQVEYYLSYVRYFRKHHGHGPALILAVAVAVSTVLRMLALPLKYPPLSRRKRTLLLSKLSACLRLLGSLFHPTIRRTATERRQ